MVGELRPCPFCGEVQHLHKEHMQGTNLHPAYRIKCDNCGGSTGYTDNDCVADWNTRADDAKLKIKGNKDD